MERKVSIVLVGIGGYGNEYVNALLDNSELKGLTIAGVVDPFPEGSRRLHEIKSNGIQVFNTLDEFYRTKHADLAVISSPIHFHKDQSCLALSRGSNVLCEKPVAASVVEANEMLYAKEKSGKFLSIGYQWSYSKSILKLKKDIISGRFGKPESLKTIVLWPRNKSYFSRKWAGKIKDDEGRLVLDSVVNNATAHYLHNMFFILGSEIDRSDIPVRVKAELYKVNDIENFDTAALHIKSKNGADIYFYASHAILESHGPIFEYVFENGVVSYDGSMRNCNIKAKLNNGEVIDYGNPYEEPMQKLWVSISAIRGESKITCPIEAAIPHVICIEGIHRSAIPREFPLSVKRFDIKSEITWVEGLSDLLLQCYSNSSLPSETNIYWAQAGDVVYT